MSSPMPSAVPRGGENEILGRHLALGRGYSARRGPAASPEAAMSDRPTRRCRRVLRGCGSRARQRSARARASSGAWEATSGSRSTPTSARPHRPAARRRRSSRRAAPGDGQIDEEVGVALTQHERLHEALPAGQCDRSRRVAQQRPTPRPASRAARRRTAAPSCQWLARRSPAPVDAIVDSVRPQRCPPRRRIDRDHRVPEPALRLVGEADHRQVRADLDDRLDVPSRAGRRSPGAAGPR